MARSRRIAARITNVHPTPRICEVCPDPIVNGQGAYVTTDERATHLACPAVR